MAGLSGLIVIGPINTRHGVVYSQDSPRRTELNLLLSSPPWTPRGDSLSSIYKTTASRNFEASRRACLGVDSKLSASSTARPGGGLPKPRPSRSRESPHCLAWFWENWGSQLYRNDVWSTATRVSGFLDARSTQHWLFSFSLSCFSFVRSLKQPLNNYPKMADKDKQYKYRQEIQQVRRDNLQFLFASSFPCLLRQVLSAWVKSHLYFSREGAVNTISAVEPNQGHSGGNCDSEQPTPGLL